MRLVFDVETDDVKASKLWCIVAQDVDTKEIFKFPPDKLSEACKLLSQADTLIGHNIIGFDIPIVEKFCNIYPYESPGGWNIIGRTPLRLFDKNNNDNPSLLSPGDNVRFRSI